MKFKVNYIDGQNNVFKSFYTEASIIGIRSAKNGGHRNDSENLNTKWHPDAVYRPR